jgi:hypothetical protein
MKTKKTVNVSGRQSLARQGNVLTADPIHGLCGRLVMSRRCLELFDKPQTKQGAPRD